MNRRDALKTLISLPIFGKIVTEAKADAVLSNTSYNGLTPVSLVDHDSIKTAEIDNIIMTIKQKKSNFMYSVSGVYWPIKRDLD